MKKSIETVWKEGFLQSDALVAPKLNQLYNQKSIHLVDKFKSKYTIHLIAMIVFSFIVLPLSFFSGLPYMGILMFILFNGVVIVNRKVRKRLEKIEKNLNSYQYISSFDIWVKDLVSVNTKLTRYLYPYTFLAIIIGYWFGSIGGNIPGEEAVNKLILNHPNTYLVFGLPLWGILGVILGVCVLALFGARIGKWDLNLVYGGILKKLEVLLADMEELRS